MSRIPNLLVIDDSLADRRYIELLIEIEEVNVNYVLKNNAIAALDYLKSCSNDVFPDVILVDVNMPLMNGYEFVENYELLFGVRFNKTRIFIMSSTCRLPEVEQAKRLRTVEDFFEKPLTEDYFLNNILKIREQFI